MLVLGGSECPERFVLAPIQLASTENWSGVFLGIQSPSLSSFYHVYHNSASHGRLQWHDRACIWWLGIWDFILTHGTQSNDKAQGRWLSVSAHARSLCPYNLNSMAVDIVYAKTLDLTYHIAQEAPEVQYRLFVSETGRCHKSCRRQRCRRHAPYSTGRWVNEWKKNWDLTNMRREQDYQGIL